MHLKYINYTTLSKNNIFQKFTEQQNGIVILFSKHDLQNQFLIQFTHSVLSLNFQFLILNSQFCVNESPCYLDLTQLEDALLRRMAVSDIKFSTKFNDLWYFYSQNRAYEVNKQFQILQTRRVEFPNFNKQYQWCECSSIKLQNESQDDRFFALINSTCYELCKLIVRKIFLIPRLNGGKYSIASCYGNLYASNGKQVFILKENELILLTQNNSSNTQDQLLTIDGQLLVYNLLSLNIYKFGIMWNLIELNKRVCIKDFIYYKNFTFFINNVINIIHIQNDNIEQIKGKQTLSFDQLTLGDPLNISNINNSFNNVTNQNIQCNDSIAETQSMLLQFIQEEDIEKINLHQLNENKNLWGSLLQKDTTVSKIPKQEQESVVEFLALIRQYDKIFCLCEQGKLSSVENISKYVQIDQLSKEQFIRLLKYDKSVAQESFIEVLINCHNISVPEVIECGLAYQYLSYVAWSGQTSDFPQLLQNLSGTQLKLLFLDACSAQNTKLIESLFANLNPNLSETNLLLQIPPNLFKQFLCSQQTQFQWKINREALERAPENCLSLLNSAQTVQIELLGDELILSSRQLIEACLSRMSNSQIRELLKRCSGCQFYKVRHVIQHVLQLNGCFEQQVLELATREEWPLHLRLSARSGAYCLSKGAQFKTFPEVLLNQYFFNDEIVSNYILFKSNSQQIDIFGRQGYEKLYKLSQTQFDEKFIEFQ